MINKMIERNQNKLVTTVNVTDKTHYLNIKS